MEELREAQQRQLHWDFPTISTSASLLMVLTAASRMRAQQPVYAERVLAYFERRQAPRHPHRRSASPTPRATARCRRPSRTTPTRTSASSTARPDGVVIRGAKLHITGAPLGHDCMVMPTKAMKPGEEDYAIACAVPVNAPGVKIINTTYAPRPT